MTIACGSCKTSYSEREFFDICEPVDANVYALAAILAQHITVSVRRCECCGETIYIVRTKSNLEDNNDRTSESET